MRWRAVSTEAFSHRLEVTSLIIVQKPHFQNGPKTTMSAIISTTYTMSISDPAVQERSIEWDGEPSVSVAVITAVASVTDREATEMEPLSNVVDTDSLNQLFEPTSRSPRTVGTVEFEYAGCLVRVSGDGRLEIVPPGDR